VTFIMHDLWTIEGDEYGSGGGGSRHFTKVSSFDLADCTQLSVSRVTVPNRNVLNQRWYHAASQTFRRSLTTSLCIFSRNPHPDPTPNLTQSPWKNVGMIGGLAIYLEMGGGL
jgi:hypothetical protein